MPESTGALSHLRICDLSGQLAGAGATRFLAAFGAQVIRVEDPVRQGRWDILRGSMPYADERRGLEYGGAFNNHNAGKLGVTVNLRTEHGKALLRKLIAVSDVVTENFAAGVMAKLGFSYDEMSALKPDLVYVSNSGFGSDGPYSGYKTFGPIVQACSGITFASGLPGRPPAGWGFSYMDHMGAYFMALGVLAGLAHRNRTGEGQWVDMSCVEAGIALAGPGLLDSTVNGNAMRREGYPDSNHCPAPPMTPHGIFPAAGDDDWVAIACRGDQDWAALAELIDEPWAREPRWSTAAGRIADQNKLDELVAGWTGTRERHDTVALLRGKGIPVALVTRPQDRIDDDPATAEWGLWPTVTHPAMGEVRVDGVPVHLSETDWSLTRGAPQLGQHNEQVFGDLLGLSDGEIAELRREGAI